MKKLLTALLIASLLPVGASVYGDDSPASNSISNLQTDTFTVETTFTHIVPRTSVFSVKKKVSSIDDDGATKIAELVLKNNTRDGYALRVTPLNGALHSDSDDDGEADIPYALHFRYDDDVSASMTAVATLDATAIGGKAALNILSLTDANGAAQSFTDTTILVSLDIDSIYSDQMKMAGSYNETLTWTYEDI
jgi:hypothetical protein